MTIIENLKKEVDEIKIGLEDLKKKLSTMSEEDKQKKVEGFKTKIDATRQKIQAEINSLADKTDDASKKKKEEAETLLNSFEETARLYSSIITPNENTNIPQTTEQSQVEEQGKEQDKSIIEKTKNAYTKTKEWVGEQWNDVWDKEKWKEEGLKNTLRTAGFVATGVGAVALAYKGVKKLWNRAFGDNEEDENEEEIEEKTNKKKKKKKKDGESSRRKKGLLWAGGIVGTVWGGTAIYKNRPAIKSRFKEKLGDTLTIEQAVVSATAEVRSGLIDESPFHYNFEDGIQYNEQKKTIKSYGWETQIDPVKKKLVGLDNVVFKDYKELIHAANITNCLKSNFHHCCSSDTPFDRTTGGGGDLQIGLADGSQPEVLSASDTNAWARIGGVGGGVVGGLLGAYCGGVPGALGGAGGGAALGAIGGNYLDNNSSMGHTVSTIASGMNFEKYRTYLNQQKSADGKSLWAHENEQIHTDTPLKDLGKKVLDEIVGTYSENGDNFNRNMDIKQDEQNPSRFYIESYNEKVPLTVEGLTIGSDNKIDYNKIKSIKIGKYKRYDRGDGLELDFNHSEDGLMEAIKVANLTNKIRKDRHDKGGEQLPFGVKVYGFHRHLQIDDRGYRGRDVVYRETLSSRFPTLWQDLKKQINQTDQGKLRIQAHGNKDQEGCESKYIRYLHQMREQSGSSYWRHEND